MFCDLLIGSTNSFQEVLQNKFYAVIAAFWSSYFDTDTQLNGKSWHICWKKSIHFPNLVGKGRNRKKSTSQDAQILNLKISHEITQVLEWIASLL